MPYATRVAMVVTSMELLQYKIVFGSDLYSNEVDVMQISIQDSHLSETELVPGIATQPINVNLYVLIGDLQEQIRCLEEENASLSSRIELLQDLCLAE
jgi:hypothetical protein